MELILLDCFLLSSEVLSHDFGRQSGTGKERKYQNYSIWSEQRGKMTNMSQVATT